MPVPKRRTSKTNRDKRRTHQKLKAPQLSHCSNCEELKLPHRVCPNCGYYKDRLIIEVDE